MTEHDPNELVTVTKTDQPTLRISRAALDQHKKLGWTHVPTVVEKVVAAIKNDETDKPAETKLSLKK